MFAMNGRHHPVVYFLILCAVAIAIVMVELSFLPAFFAAAVVLIVVCLLNVSVGICHFAAVKTTVQKLE